MMTNILILAIALFMVGRGATLATRYAIRVAETLRFSKYIIGFLVIAVISILPELMISLNAAFRGDSSFGLGLILGSNIADLTLIFALVVLFAGRGVKVEQKILKNHSLYPFILMLPLVLGIDGAFTRVEGAGLILAGVIFYYLSLKKHGTAPHSAHPSVEGRTKNILFLIISLVVLLIGAHFTVSAAAGLALSWGVSAALIGMLVVALGTTMPELFFSIKSVKQNDDSLAVGDLLGTVLADATIVIGLIAVIAPFTFPQTTIYVGGVFMVAAAFILFSFMRSHHTITKLEAFALFMFWLTFAAVQFIVHA